MSMHILLVEDDELVRPALVAALRAKQHEVTVTKDGQEAVDLMAAGFVPDAILSDGKMPRLTGQELVEWARHNPSTANTPFVLWSGNPDHEWLNANRIRLLRFVFLQKPLRARQILEALEKAKELVSAQ